MLLPSGPTPLSPPPRELDKLPFLKTRTSYFLYFFLDILLSDLFPFRFPLCLWSSRLLLLLPCWGFLPFSHPSANSCPQAQGGYRDMYMDIPPHLRQVPPAHDSSFPLLDGGKSGLLRPVWTRLWEAPMGDRGLVIRTTGLITACLTARLFALEVGKGRGGSSIRLHSHDKKIKAWPPACLFS